MVTLRPMVTEPVKIGMIGHRGFAAFCAEVFHETGHGRVVAFSGRDAAAMKESAAHFGVGKAFTDWRELIADPEVELVHIAEMAFTATESQVILGLLALVDLSLTGSLVIIVIFSGYENFVSKIDHSRHRDWPEWMGTIDFTALKIKLLGSIVAISAIQLLKQFMSIATVSDRDLFWLVVIHVVFVVSSVLLALSDRISEGTAHPAKSVLPEAHDGKQ